MARALIPAGQQHRPHMPREAQAQEMRAVQSSRAQARKDPCSLFQLRRKRHVRTV
uniref:Uncharacterized protein n=1 Tax=Setaria italica TaxID=4555 RepID=K4A4J4_SETIT